MKPLRIMWMLVWVLCFAIPVIAQEDSESDLDLFGSDLDLFGSDLDLFGSDLDLFGNTQVIAAQILQRAASGLFTPITTDVDSDVNTDVAEQRYTLILDRLDGQSILTERDRNNTSFINTADFVRDWMTLRDSVDLDAIIVPSNVQAELELTDMTLLLTIHEAFYAEAAQTMTYTVVVERIITAPDVNMDSETITDPETYLVDDKNVPETFGRAVLTINGSQLFMNLMQVVSRDRLSNIRSVSDADIATCRNLQTTIDDGLTDLTTMQAAVYDLLENQPDRDSDAYTEWAISVQALIEQVQHLRRDIRALQEVYADQNCDFVLNSN